MLLLTYFNDDQQTYCSSSAWSFAPLPKLLSMTLEFIQHTMIDKLSFIANVATRANIYHHFKPRGESIAIRTSFVDVGSDKLVDSPVTHFADIT